MTVDVLTLLANVVNPVNFSIMTAGVAGGIVVGALPGLTATMGLALLIPFTFTMEPIPALMMLGGVYVGAIYGGSISAILISTPGTPSAIATVFDGFPLTRKGKAEHALVTAAFTSGVGGVFGAVILLGIAPPLARFALAFGPAEMFWVAIFGLTIIATLASKSLVKGLIGGLLGLLLSSIGLAPIGGDMRFSFGFWQLQGGIDLIVGLIGLFCIPEVFHMLEKKGEKRYFELYKPQKGVARSTIIELIKKPVLLLRSSIIGVIVGIIPGAGGNIAGILSYDQAARWSKHPEEFGTGIIDGVAASEAANNAAVGGALVPLLTFGIPGAPPAAVLLGVLMIHGLRIGPELFTTFGHITYTFLIALIMANIVMFVLGFYGARQVARMVNLPENLIAPIVALLCVIGSFAIRNNMLDVGLMMSFGFIGYVTRKLGFDPGPIVLGLILGPIAEIGLTRAMLLGKAAGSIWVVFFTHPISIVLIILCVLSLLWPVIVRERTKRRIQRGEKVGVE